MNSCFCCCEKDWSFQTLHPPTPKCILHTSVDSICNIYILLVYNNLPEVKSLCAVHILSLGYLAEIWTHPSIWRVKTEGCFGSWKMRVMTNVGFAGRQSNCLALQKLLCCNFFRHYEYDKCQTLHVGTTHWALPVHTTFQWPWRYFKVSSVKQFLLKIIFSYLIKSETGLFCRLADFRQIKGSRDHFWDQCKSFEKILGYM